MKRSLLLLVLLSITVMFMGTSDISATMQVDDDVGFFITDDIDYFDVDLLIDPCETQVCLEVEYQFIWPSFEMNTIITPAQSNEIYLVKTLCSNEMVYVLSTQNHNQVELIINNNLMDAQSPNRTNELFEGRWRLEIGDNYSPNWG